MRHLASYIAAIRQRRSLTCIESMTLEASSWQEDGLDVTRETITYRFTDGAMIFCSAEQDSGRSMPTSARNAGSPTRLFQTGIPTSGSRLRE